jgi:hypothetical protein
MPDTTVPLESDVEFLTEEFDIPPFRAARLVAGRTDRVDDLVAKEFQRQHETDPLADVPTPTPPKDVYVKDADEQMLKPIVGQHNLRGAG